MKISIVSVTSEHLEQIAELFDDYRVFYNQVSDLGAARKFLSDRIKLKESVLFLAFYNGVPCGFTQLYPVFSSVTMERSFILNDLFVAENFRKNGIGKALLEAAKNKTINDGYKGLALETHPENPARRLYEKEGWKEDNEFVHYFWKNEFK